MKKLTVAISCALLLGSGSAIADKPNWAGKGKPNIEEVQSVSDVKAMSDEIEEREKEIDLLIEQNQKKAKKSKNKIEKQKLEEGTESLKRGKDELQDSKEKLKEKKKGFEKQKMKKTEQEQKELDKGSETGQKKREENSNKWWNFWE